MPAAPHKVDLGTGDLLIRNVGSEIHLKSSDDTSRRFAAHAEARGRLGAGQVQHQCLARCLVSIPVSEVRQ